MECFEEAPNPDVILITKQYNGRYKYKLIIIKKL